MYNLSNQVTNNTLILLQISSLISIQVVYEVSYV